MRLAMAQMQMADSIDENLQKTVHSMELAKEAGADFIFVPSVWTTGDEPATTSLLKGTVVLSSMRTSLTESS